MKLNRKLSVVLAGMMIASMFAVSGCSNNSDSSSGESTSQEQKATEVKDMTGDELVSSMGEENAVVIDARDAEEFKAGHIDGAINVFVDEAESKLSDLEQYKDSKVMVYCNSGKKSGKLAELLVENGFTDVYNADGVKEYEYNLVKGE